MAGIGGGGAYPIKIEFEHLTLLEGAGRCHPTQLMLDIIPEGTSGEGPKDYTLEKYMKREPGYDLSFTAAWLQSLNLPRVTNAYHLFSTFTKIHELAMGHITAKMSPKEKLEFQYSPQTGHSFCVGMGPNSDLEGIMDLAKQILFEGKRTCLALYTEEKSDRLYIDYGVMDGDFFQLNRRTDEHKKLFTKNQLSADKRVKEISNFIAQIYNSGTIGEGTFPVRITSLYRTNEDRGRKAIELMTAYFNTIEEPQNEQEKIEKICLLCRELEQLHYFVDGNGRTVFILANTLLSWNGLKPFYPTNTCIFDANSLTRMVKEVTEGQKRFAAMFGTKQQFNANLTDYQNKVEILNSLIAKKFSNVPLIVKLFEERNFNLLLRQCATSESFLEVLQLLLENQFHLPIDIQSRGTTSGTAMDIAIAKGNTKAIALLELYQRVTPEDKLEALNSLIMKNCSNVKSIVKSFQEKNFNFLLRLSASSEKYLEVLQFLLENQSDLPIDIQSKGATSGTAMDIAKVKGNAKAIELLTPYFQTGPDAS